jgi:alpha-L-arabinofuranosidase
MIAPVERGLIAPPSGGFMRGIRAFLFIAVIVSAYPALGRDNDVVRLGIDADDAGTKIDRHVFGQFAEHLGRGIYEGVWVGPDSSIPNTRGIRNDVVAALKALQVPVVRWPGGCFADEYHWRKGIGPDGADASYTETIMKAWQSKVWSWDIEGLSLHSYTVGKWPPSYKATGFDEREYAAVLKETLRMEELLRTHSAIMDKYDPQKKISLVVDEWGSWLAPTPGTNPAFLEQRRLARSAYSSAMLTGLWIWCSTIGFSNATCWWS